MGVYQLNCGKKSVYKKANSVECVTELACQLSDVISLGAVANLISCEKTADGVNYKARIVFNAVYLLEGEVRRKEFGIELNDFYKLSASDSVKAYVNLEVEGVSAKRGEKLSLEAIVTALIYIEEQAQNDLLIEKENCLARQKQLPYTEFKSRCEQKFVIEDEIEINKQLKNVLCSNANGVVSCQSGLGSVICDGEIIVALALLPNEEKSDIIKENRIIPFRLEIENSNVNVSDLSSAKIRISDLSIKAVVDEERGKTTLSCQIEVVLSATVYKAVTVTYADDMFSLDKELSLAKESFELTSFIKQKTHNEKIGGKAFCIPPENSRILCALEERVYALSFKQEGQEITLEGVLSCYVTFENVNSGAICSKLAETPFAIKLNCEGEIKEVEATCRSLQAKIRNDEVYLEGEIIVVLEQFKTQSIMAITTASDGEDKVKDCSAFCIYSPQKSDTLWDVVKALGVSEEEILTQNEIKLPFTGEEKIIIYKKA